MTLPVTNLAQALSGLAVAWLEQGAQSFSLWLDDRPLAMWPEGSAFGPATVVVPLALGSGQRGELRLRGLAGAEVQMRLEAEAQLVAHLLRLEYDLESMTAELVERQDQLLALYDLSQSTRHHVDLQRMLETLVAEAARLLRVEGAFVVLHTPGGLQVVSHPPDGIEGVDAERLFEAVSAGGHELLLNGSFPQGLPGRVRNLLMIPMRSHETIIAGLGLVNKITGDLVSPDVKLASAIAQQAGIQIENMILYQETLKQARLQTEMDLARRVQTRLLPPHPPYVVGAEIFAHSRPALHVGGDFYDLVSRPGRPFVFAVGDVTGKGMSAALLMAIARTVLHSSAFFMPAPTPAALLRRLSEDLYEYLIQVGMFVTAFVAEYRDVERKLIFANAGHAPVIYCTKDRPAAMLEADGVAVGVLPTSHARNRVVPFGPGDLLVAATDGFCEASNAAGELYGYERLLRLVYELRRERAGTIGSALFAEMDRFGSGRDQEDDQTLVVVKGVEHG